MIVEAEGQAEALERVYEAQAPGIKLINDAAPNEVNITLRGYQTFEKVANGQATKIIIPSELQNMAGLLAGAKALLEKDEPVKTEQPVNEVKSAEKLIE